MGALIELLAVDVGRRGLRARRYAGERDAGSVDIPDLRLAPGVGPAEVVDALQPLAEGAAPGATVFSFADAARQVDVAEVFAAWAPRCGGAPTLVVDQLVAAHAGALDGVGPGVVLEAGAHAAALGGDGAGAWRRVDGWGPVLGDRGSAAWIGAQGLAAAARHADGVPGGSAALWRAARDRFGDPRAGADAAADFAADVGRAAVGDPVAEGIIRLAAEHLADSLASAAQVAPGAPWAVTGELLVIEALRVALAATLGARHRILIPGLGDALAGARLLAEALAGGRAPAHRPPLVFHAAPPALGS